jgi:diguanylate cyclase (GGDEF)-like protein/PAS domain S-box-containing protein
MQDRVVDINPAALALIGLTGPPLIGQPASRVFAVWPNLIARYAQVYQERTTHEIGPGRWIDLRITALRDQAGNVTGRLIVMSDVSELKQTQASLEEVNAQLRDQLAQIEHLQDQLREQAIRDPLTGLFNRRYLEETLYREISRAARDRFPLSLVLLDLDHFKAVNDTYGHAAGDRVLQALALMLMLHTRQGDIVCRYGGEEIVAVLPGAPSEVALARAEQWRAQFAQSAVEQLGQAAQTTFSAGVATFPQHGATSEAVLRAADQALYAAKAAGRNRVQLARPDPSSQAAQVDAV